ncbi:MAG: hypothetical protein ABSH37_04740 [Bryobacteraceae bacterium]|jgi:hypothetical protein
MRILLVLPAGENVRVTPERPEVPKRAMLRFSVLSLTIVAALTPRRPGGAGFAAELTLPS